LAGWENSATCSCDRRRAGDARDSNPVPNGLGRALVGVPLQSARLGRACAGWRWRTSLLVR
jgi:hypothetical protein